MAATFGTFPIKILTQVGDNEPIQVGTYELPIRYVDGNLAPDVMEFKEWLQGNGHDTL